MQKSSPIAEISTQDTGGGLLFTFTLYYACVADDNLPLHFAHLSVHGLLQLGGYSFHSINKAQ